LFSSFISKYGQRLVSIPKHRTTYVARNIGCGPKDSHGLSQEALHAFGIRHPADRVPVHVSLLGKGLEIDMKRLPESPCRERRRRRTGVPERLDELVEAAASTGGLRSESFHLVHPYAQYLHKYSTISSPRIPM